MSLICAKNDTELDFMAQLPALEDRASGLLLHPTSLANEYPIGDLGPAAYAFVDSLARSGQRWWQMLPLTPLGAGHSPYQSPSAFAGNPLLIAIDPLIEKGWLPAEVKRTCPTLELGRVNYEAAEAWKIPVLKRAFATFEAESTAPDRKRFEVFCRKEAEWLEDYALFATLSDVRSELDWTQWSVGLRSRTAEALAEARRQYLPHIRFHQFLQWVFREQWLALRHFCGERGVGLIGDVPIFVAPNSADVWAHPEIFQLTRDGKPKVVAGVPPDYFAEKGQKWGNPHYRWDVLREQGYQWWVDRLANALDTFDAVRLDHFIGFTRYYEIESDAPSAEHGTYKPGPGAAFFKSLQRKWKRLPLIAEDLGRLTPEVEAVRDAFELPGMKVLQFGFEADPGSRIYQPHRFPVRCIAYTGTHDNDTTVGWFSQLDSDSRARVQHYIQSDGREIHWDMIRLALASVAQTAIIPVQDVLGLGSEARMNRPGVPNGNWTWRMTSATLPSALEERLRLLSSAYQRI